MWDIVREAVRPANIVWTTLLLVVVLYWLMVILGALDLDFLTFDMTSAGDIDAEFDMDIEPDFEADFDADADIDGDLDGGGGGALGGFFQFFYIGEIPVMVVASLFVVAGWFVSIIANHAVNPGSFVLGLAVAGGAIVAGLFTAKVLGIPMLAIFRKLNVQPQTTKDIIGKICVVISSQVSESMGQAEVRGEGAPVTLNAKCTTGATLGKGDEAVVVSRDAKTGIYFIEPFDLEN